MENVCNFSLDFIFFLAQNVNDVIVNYNAAHDQQRNEKTNPPSADCRRSVSWYVYRVYV